VAKVTDQKETIPSVDLWTPWHQITKCASCDWAVSNGEEEEEVSDPGSCPECGEDTVLFVGRFRYIIDPGDRYPMRWWGFMTPLEWQFKTGPQKRKSGRMGFVCQYCGAPNIPDD